MMTAKRDKTVWIILFWYIVILALVILGAVSCNQTVEAYKIDTEATDTVDAFDSVILNSQKNLKIAEIATKRSDSTVNVVIAEKAAAIEELRVAAAPKLNTAYFSMMGGGDGGGSVQGFPARPDTVYVYVETEKNFWGKRKLKNVIISDTLIKDFLIDNQVVSDTIVVTDTIKN